MARVGQCRLQGHDWVVALGRQCSAVGGALKTPPALRSFALPTPPEPFPTRRRSSHTHVGHEGCGQHCLSTHAINTHTVTHTITHRTVSLALASTCGGG